MELYILRHGLAEDRSSTGNDRDRVLTPEGREKTRAAGKALRKMEIIPDLVLSSPFARAWQTAEIIVQECGCTKTLQACDALIAGASTEGVIEALSAAAAKHASLMAVGHEPDLSTLISVLLSGTPDLAITMKKGGLAKLTCETVAPGGARLEWLLGPKQLSRLG
jgi:phosphohistidine phosphatase